MSSFLVSESNTFLNVRPSPFYQCFHFPDWSFSPSPGGLYHCLLNPDWSFFREHLSRALPTYLLQSIRSECLVREYSAKLMLDTVEIIVEWLQVSVSDKPLKLKI